MIAGAGVSLSMGGCRALPTRGESKSTDEPVNTGLNSIANGPGLTLPKDQELMSPGEFGSVYDQIEESARQLNVYFTNLQIDGVEPATPDSRTRIPALSDQTQTQAQIQATGNANSGAVGGVSDPSMAQNLVASQAGGAQKTSDNPGVHISLLGGGGDDVDVNDGQRVQQDDGGVPSPAAQGDGEESGTMGTAGSGGVASTKPKPNSASEAIAGVEPEGAMDPQARKRALASELASILATLASTSDDPGSAALALASLETLLPDDTGTLIDEGVLSDGERTSLDAARAFLRSMSSAGSIASPEEVGNELESIQAKLSAWTGITIKKAALCTRVDGFGRYEPFNSYRFVAGRPHRAIVYVELEHFTQHEILGPDGQPRYQTKLSQRLELYHVADDLNTWNRAAETVSDETRNHLHDYYLTNQITLPATLGVGRYHLKVVMRDLLGDRVSERILPIEIVAQP